MIRLRRIISGGQTGVDRGALEAAACLGLDRGGYAPRRWLAEDGEIPEWYRYGMEIVFSLKATSLTLRDRYAVRTRANVEGSGGTLILSRNLPLSGGAATTKWMCKQHLRPCHVSTFPIEHSFIRWLSSHNINTLNVAGPTESKDPGIQEQARDALIAVLGPELPAVDVFGWDPPR